MQCNVGGADRLLRIVLGVLVLALGVYYRSWWGLVGLLPLGTALLRWCPLYLPWRLSTCAKRPKP